MSADVRPAARAGATAEPTGPPDPRWRQVVPPLAMLVLVGLSALLPLRNTSNFYFWDDTAAVAVAVWQRVAEDVLAGRFPALHLDLWRGGNFAGEAATGMLNPLALLLMVATYPLDDVALAITIAKFFFLAIMALGVYLLAREYGARPWPAAIVGAALPVSGFTLYLDAAGWVNGLMVTAVTPWLWWLTRRWAYGRGPMLLVLLAGYTLASLGNPYGLLTLSACLAAVAIEMWFLHRRRQVWWLAGALATLVLLSVVVYLPFLLTSSVSYRVGSKTYNDEFLSPGLSHLLGASTPSFLPYIFNFDALSMAYPGLYLAWFVLPLLPWIRWGALAPRWRELSGIAAFATFFGLFVLGPSNVWMFRWPARLLPYLMLALLVGFAVAVSPGLARTAVRARAGGTAALVFLGGWLAWGDRPDLVWRHLLGTVVVAVLVTLLLRRRAMAASAFAVAAVGQLVVLGLQTTWAPVNTDTANWAFPHSRSELVERFEDRYRGVTVQVASFEEIRPRDRNADRAWQDLLLGSVYSIAGVESPTAYSGIGFNAMDRTLCMKYEGSTCAEAWDALWREPGGSDTILADLLRAETVVTQHELVDTRDDDPPRGWSQAEVTDFVTVWRRDDPLPWPDGRVSAAEGVQVTDARLLDDTSEHVELGPTGVEPGVVTFARLAWPGYEATRDGEELETRLGPAGLLQVVVPPGTPAGTVEVSWSPPGWSIGLAAAAAGLLLGSALAVADAVRRQRRREQGQGHQRPTGTYARAGRREQT